MTYEEGECLVGLLPENTQLQTSSSQKGYVTANDRTQWSPSTGTVRMGT